MATTAKEYPIPDTLFVLYERGLLLGTFITEGAAERMCDGRIKAGKIAPEMVTYTRTRDEQAN